MTSRILSTTPTPTLLCGTHAVSTTSTTYVTVASGTVPAGKSQLTGVVYQTVTGAVPIYSHIQKNGVTVIGDDGSFDGNPYSFYGTVPVQVGDSITIQISIANGYSATMYGGGAVYLI